MLSGPRKDGVEVKRKEQTGSQAKSSCARSHPLSLDHEAAFDEVFSFFLFFLDFHAFI